MRWLGTFMWNVSILISSHLSSKIHGNFFDTVSVKIERRTMGITPKYIHSQIRWQSTPFPGGQIAYLYVERTLRYDSKFKNEVKDEIQRVKQDHRTMGYAKEPVPKPSEFLKAHEKEPKLPQPNTFSIFLKLIFI